MLLLALVMIIVFILLVVVLARVLVMIVPGLASGMNMIAVVLVVAFPCACCVAYWDTFISHRMGLRSQ